MPDAVASPARLAWLDALRGIAALCVVFDHLSYSVLQPVRDSVYQWFDPGQYGVFVFFLVSGYIVPASLERKGSVRGFWVSRVFRLYPLYLFAVGAMIVLWASGIGSLSGMDTNTVTASFADVFMLQSVLWAPTLPNVVWSLAYEMVFYLLLTALFLGGVHRRSSRYALVFAVAALALGRVLQPGSLSYDLFTPGAVVAVTDSLILLGLVLALAGRGRSRTAGAGLAAATGLLVIMFNSGYAAPWESFAIFALMFTGTMLYRAETGAYPWRRAFYVLIGVAGFVLVAAQVHSSPQDENFTAIARTLNSLEFAGLTFAVAMLCRRRKVPRALAWLGLVSYSVYLLHPALIEVYASVPFTRNENFVPMELLLVAAFVAVLLGCCGLTHRFIEAPMQRTGRRVGARLDARFGPDTRETLVLPDAPVTPDSPDAPDSLDGEGPPASFTADQAVSGTPRAAGAGPR
ncbi:MAG TPA: acyltransferase [Streptosporangiaceae bacterium]|nr:acyltransferase [Streptosporangiaceae bacterium]